MVLWTIYVLPTEESEVKAIEIDSEQTFSAFRTKVSNTINVNCSTGYRISKVS